MYEAIDALIDEGSFFDIKKLFAPEMITGFARIEGQPVGIIANQPKVKGGVLFVDSADKATKFITLCDAFSIPLFFLADVPGFMIGTKVERAEYYSSWCKTNYGNEFCNSTENFCYCSKSVRCRPLCNGRSGV